MDGDGRQGVVQLRRFQQLAKSLRISLMRRRSPGVVKGHKLRTRPHHGDALRYRAASLLTQEHLVHQVAGSRIEGQGTAFVNVHEIVSRLTWPDGEVQLLLRAFTPGATNATRTKNVRAVVRSIDEDDAVPGSPEDVRRAVEGDGARVGNDGLNQPPNDVLGHLVPNLTDRGTHIRASSPELHGPAAGADWHAP
jgi:hypothetical protein